MTDNTLLGPWVRRFLLEHLIVERNLSLQTQRSYRDTLRMLLPFVAGQWHQALDRLRIEQLSAPCIRDFLEHLESVRHCTAATRNQRLAAIRALAAFVAAHSPEHIAWCADIHRIPFKKTRLELTRLCRALHSRVNLRPMPAPGLRSCVRCPARSSDAPLRQ